MPKTKAEEYKDEQDAIRRSWGEKIRNRMDARQNARREVEVSFIAPDKNRFTPGCDVEAAVKVTMAGRALPREHVLFVVSDGWLPDGMPFETETDGDGVARCATWVLGGAGQYRIRARCNGEIASKELEVR